MVQERTEEQKIVQAPLLVILGGKEYEVKPLSIRDSRTWRARVAKLLGELPQYITTSTDDAQAFQRAMDVMMSGMTNTITDLFFDYARTLNRDEIETVATDIELSKAFQEVLAFAFPLVQSLTQILKKLKA